MRIIPGLVLALLVSTGVAAPASAFTPGGTFLLTGPFTLSSPPVTCTATFTVSGSVITSVLFSGSPACGSLSARSLPWPVTPISPTAIKITPMIIKSPLSTCSAASVTGAWNNASPGVATFSGVSAPPCVISMTLSASPAQTLP